ncbi:conjugal transfer protein TraI [Rodentibacter sp. JRC1]|uniref:MobF family relaxase n=1 Tax=Rodentibacter sp. JRC1 TaxID=2874504 RepID=UPI001CFD5862|nr:MobF family relaxase [Rodentibacter sp. JRC1]GJI56972.1 conjugal transfer protein TraI [Rodentibacter sp. JRC1]
MLSVAKVGSSGGAANYYSQEDNYYFLGEQSTKWFGEGAKRLGLEGAVDKETFKQVLEGYLPDGSDLSHIRKGENVHRPGYDYTFSAPKSVSLLALIKGDKDVLNAHKSAVEKVMTEIESLASTRSMETREKDIVETKNLVTALFLHDTNRNLEPHLHTHAIVANATYDTTTEKFKTLSTDKVGNEQGFVEVTWNNKIALGKLYRSFLKEELAAQGFEFEHTGKNGLWEIKGIPAEVLKEFSTRRQEILASVEPDASQKSLGVAAKDTRNVKDFSNQDEVKKEWVEKWDELLGKDFDINSIKVTPEQLQARLTLKTEQTAAIDKALPEVISEIAKTKAKFSRAEIADKLVDKVYFEGGGFSSLVSERIDKLIEQKELIITDNKQNYFTTPAHLSQESVVTALVSKLDNQVHHLRAETLSQIAAKIESDHKNLNLFSVRGRRDYDAKLVSDLQTFANENHKTHIVVVANHQEKNMLNGKLDKETFVFTAADYLRSDYADKNNLLVTLYRSEKMNLDTMSGLLSKSYTHQNTVVLLDTGGRNQKGLTRDLAVDLGINDTLLKESAERKHIVMMNNVDKNDQLSVAVKAYMGLAFTGKNVVMQVSQATNTNTNLREKLTALTRQTLLDNGLLGERTTSIQSKEPAYIKLDANGKPDYQNPSNYQKGDTIERINKGKVESWTILDVSRKDKTLAIRNNQTGERENDWEMKRLNSEYQLFRNVRDIEIRVGDKLHSMGKTNSIRANQDLTVIGISKPNIFTKQKIKLEDGQGKIFTLNAGEETKLGYGYVEAVAKSQRGERDVIISVLQDNQTNDKTLSDVQKGADRILAITATSDSVIAKRIDLHRSQISLTRSLENMYEVTSLDAIKAESVRAAFDNSRMKKEINARIEAIQSKGDWVSFRPSNLIASLESSGRFSKQEIMQYVSERIEKGDYRPMDGKSKDLYSAFYLKESVQTEKHLLNLLDKGIGTQEAILPEAKKLLEGTSLNEGQRNAAEMILTNKDRIVNLQGLAGVGKTYQLNVVASLIEQHRPDITIKALAPTHKAKEELLRSKQIADGDTFANFLITAKQDQSRFDKTLFIIDESSMIGNKTGTELLNTIIERGGRIVLSGDHSQLSALESGDVFRLGQKFSHVAKAEMNQIMRQSNDILRGAVEAVAIDKDIRKSLSLIEKQTYDVARIKQEDAPSSKIAEKAEASYQNVVKDYMSRSEQAQKNTQIITATNHHRIGLNNEIQKARFENGAIKNGVEMTIYRRENLSEADLKTIGTWKENTGNVLKMGEQYYQIQSVSNEGEIWLDNGTSRKMLNVIDSTADLAIFRIEKQSFYEGDTIRINATDKNKTTENNALGVVVSTADGKIQADFGNGARTLDPINNQADRHIDLGYAITSMASQGGSFENVILYVDTNMKNFVDMKNAYVDISRVKDHLQMYVTDRERYVELVEADSGVRMTAYEQDLAIKREILSEASQMWENSRNLKDVYNFKDRFDDNVLTQSSRISFKGKESELLLATTDEEGRYTGNLVIPVNPYRGEIHYGESRLEATEDARFIILNQGDGDKPAEILTLNGLAQAQEFKDQEKTVIIVLDEQDKGLKVSDLVEEADRIAEKLSADDLKEIEQIAKEIIQEEDKELMSAQTLELSEEKETTSPRGRDENNILRHAPEEEPTPKIKELV